MATPIKRAFRTPLAFAALVMISIVALLAIFGPIIWGAQASEVNISNMLAPPSWEHWAGTDALGRDLFTRVLVATRLTVLLTLEATAIGVSGGILFGCGPFLLGPRFGKAVTWFIGIAVAFPGLLLALFFAIIFGAGASSAALALGLASAPSFARLCQTLVAGILARDYVGAAQISGSGRFRILIRHILPNIGEPLIVNATIGAGSVLLSFAGLSFLGLGVQAPAYDWGRLLMECLRSIYVHPIASVTPGVAVVLAGLAFNLTGESLAHALGITSLGDLGLRAKIRSLRHDPSITLDTDEPTQDAIVCVRDLHVGFPAGLDIVEPVRGVSFDIFAGEAVGLVGESGCGKSLTALAVAQLLEEPAQVWAHSLIFHGTELLDCGNDNKETTKARNHLLGTSMAMIFQDPMTSLNPTRRVGEQLAELGRVHGGLNHRQARLRAIERLGAVRITNPERRARQYPYEFSGGMRQRAMIGVGVMLTPKLIIADEPTTALDVIVQEQILDLLGAIRREDGAALLLISHDVSVVREVCSRILVMYAGRIIEELPSADLDQARHPYTRLLVAAVPNMTTDITQPLPTIPGRPPEPGPIVGCSFSPRCPLADDRCRSTDPDLITNGNTRVACWHAGQPLVQIAEVVE